MALSVDFSSYHPVNAQQQAFHASAAPHRALIGGVGAGKTFPCIHASIFHCIENPNHNFAVFRNTWPSLTENVEKEFVDLASHYRLAGDKDWVSAKHNLRLKNGCTVMFRPLTMTTAQIKGMNLCGFYVDDPDTKTYKTTLGFLFSRLRDRGLARAKSFRTIWAANYEGSDWLWKTFVQRNGEDKPQGQWGGPMLAKNGETITDNFAYWICPTKDNPTLPDDYISTLAAVHSQSWMDRYVHMENLDSYSGLIYPEYDAAIHARHDLSKCEREDLGLIKTIAIDVGLGVTCVYCMATDQEALYVYREWYKKDVKPWQLAEYVKSLQARERFQKVLIDPSSARKEQTSGTSMKQMLRDYGIVSDGAVNNVPFGIQTMRDLLAPASGNPLIYIDPRCVKAKTEFENYRRKESSESNDEEIEFSEDPVKKKDHAMDTIRYLAVHNTKYLKNRMDKMRAIKSRREQLMQDRISNLKMYQAYPGSRDVAALAETYRSLRMSSPRARSILRAMQQKYRV